MNPEDQPAITEASLTVCGGKRRGRPRVTEPRTSVCVWLPAPAHDRLIALAKRHELSVSATVRQLLLRRLP